MSCFTVESPFNVQPPLPSFALQMRRDCGKRTQHVYPIFSLEAVRKLFVSF